ncbi:MAG: carboxymuconolactone decarboxylase family protein [bacterium]|nr:carboxymuconolactone decarboxylase family protein [bacterium]
MKRISILDKEELSTEQLEIYNKILASRPSIAGPFEAWLHSPEFADKAQEVGKFVRFNTSLSSNLSELVILTVARYWNCQNEWSIHEPFAVDAGLDRKIINAINHSEKIEFNNEKESIVYDYTKQLLEKQFIEDSLYAKILNSFNEKTIVELTGLIGYYSMVALTLNAFQIRVPQKVAPKLSDCPTF